VWDNGYLKRMYDEERWEGTIKLGGSTTSSESWYECIMYYDYAESLFNEEDAEAYEGEDWATLMLEHYKEELDSIG